MDDYLAPPPATDKRTRQQHSGGTGKYNGRSLTRIRFGRLAASERATSPTIDSPPSENLGCAWYDVQWDTYADFDREDDERELRRQCREQRKLEVA